MGGTRAFGVAAALGVVAAVALALPLASTTTRAAAVNSTASAEDGWQPFAPAVVRDLTSAGRPVFVDFTAAWCVTCQVNKRTTLARPRVQAAFADAHVALVRADWTRRDPAITAAWCVTCQVNKRTTLARPRVQAAFADAHVALVRADWTRRDPAITEALAALGRNGVPAYVLYRPGKSPLLLPEILTQQTVFEALATLRG